MLRLIPNVEQKTEGILISCTPVYFQEDDLSLATGGLPAETQEDSLGLCWMSSIGASVLAIISGIASPEASKQFLQLIQYMERQLKAHEENKIFPLRALSLQLNTPEAEWPFVPRHHFYVSKLGKEQGLSAQIAHLNIPVHPVLQTKGLDISEFYLKDAAGLPVQQNAEGWFQYYFWLQEEIELIKEQFVPESVGEYTLEACFADFMHEVRGALLKGVEEEINELVARLGSVDPEATSEIKALEREIIRKRFVSYRGLKSQQEALRAVNVAIKAVLDARPDLVDLSMKTKALIEFASAETDENTSKSCPWDQRMLWMQLLNSLIGVVTVISCDEDWDRALLTFSVQLSVAQTIEIEGVPESYQMILQWNDITKMLNQLAHKGGRKEMQAWLESHDKAEEKKLAEMILRFRERVWENLKGIYNPIKKLSISKAKAAKNQDAQSDGRINTEFLNFLPAYVNVASEDGHKWVRTIDYDEEGMPTELGRLALKRLGL